MLVVRSFSAPGKYNEELEYSLSNVGNLQLLLKDIELLTGRNPLGKAVTSYHVSDSNCPEIPIVIEPNQVKLIRVHFLNDTIEKAKKNKERCFVTFAIVSPQAKMYEIMHDITALGEHRTEAECLIWKPFKMGGK